MIKNNSYNELFYNGSISPHHRKIKHSQLFTANCTEVHNICNHHAQTHLPLIKFNISLPKTVVKPKQKHSKFSITPFEPVKSPKGLQYRELTEKYLNLNNDRTQTLIVYH